MRMWCFKVSFVVLFMSYYVHILRGISISMGVSG
jgi:hypothetical protein